MAEGYMKKTRDTLGKIIKKPPLTDKLLGKPPFRFLHDVFTEVIRTTGFLNGLFTSTEMDSKSVSAKEDKIAFLQKVIDVVAIVSGEQLSVRPSKIVAGHEPEKTNELLQKVAKCIHKNVSSDDAVQQVLSGKKPSKVEEKPPAGPSKRKEGKENREKPDEQKKKRRDRDEDKHERERSSDRRRRSAGKERRERSHDKDATEQGAGEGNEEKERNRSRDKSKDKERNKEDRSRDRKEERRERKESKASKSKDLASTSKKGVERKSSTKSLQKSLSVEKKQKSSKQKISRLDGAERKRRKSQSRKEEETPDQDESERHREANEDEEKPEPDAREEAEESGEKPASSRPPRPASAKGHRRRPAQDRGSRGAAPESQEASPKESRSRPARPPSARPAAPRVRQRPDAAEEEIARMESAGRQRTAPIIVDRGSRQAGEGLSSSEDEDEQFLVQEEDVQPPELGKLSPVLNGDVNGEPGEEEGEHGGLVRKILETKKELETSASKGANVMGKKRTEIERAPVNEVQRRKEREVVMRDIEKLRGSVQKLCRSAVPLGKIIDYIQEDMDSMQNELLQWRKENKEQAARLKEEESVTIRTIEPLQAELEELDRSIAAQLDMIAASKCNVIRNQEKIDKMVAGVTARS